MRAILFVCTGNLYRSPLAAALFRRRLEMQKTAGTWKVDSAGTWAIEGQPSPPDLIQAAHEYHVQLQDHTSRLVTLPLLQGYDLILVMEKGQMEGLKVDFPGIHRNVFLLSEVVDGQAYDIHDPVTAHLSAREFAKQMDQLIERGFPRIVKLAQKCLV